jgi:flavin reductase (DIM6/NTAB) family NADH-FMN oxidoreductase RutF
MIMNGIATLEDKSEVLKHVMRNWVSGVSVLTSSCVGARAGTTVSSFTSLSLDPPLVLVNIAKENPLQTMIMESGFFGLSMKWRPLPLQAIHLFSWAPLHTWTVKSMTAVNCQNQS